MPLTDEALLARLVAFDSTSHRSNLALAEFMAEYVDRPGVRIARNPSADGTKVNLVVTAGPDDRSRRGLMLCGHMDVVPAGDTGWHSDPFTLSRVGGTFVGRGACDMKGFLALALNRFAALDPDRLVTRIALVFTYDEEVGTLGARRLAETWTDPELLPRSAVVGEPTSLAVVRMHRARAHPGGADRHTGAQRLPAPRAQCDRTCRAGAPGTRSTEPRPDGRTAAAR